MSGTRRRRSLPLVIALVSVATWVFLARAVAAETATVRYDGRALFKVSSTTKDAARVRAVEIARRISAVADANRGSIVELAPDGAVTMHTAARAISH